jgi:hypothetical protein
MRAPASGARSRVQDVGPERFRLDGTNSARLSPPPPVMPPYRSVAAHAVPDAVDRTCQDHGAAAASMLALAGARPASPWTPRSSRGVTACGPRRTPIRSEQFPMRRNRFGLRHPPLIERTAWQAPSPAVAKTRRFRTRRDWVRTSIPINPPLTCKSAWLPIRRILAAGHDGGSLNRVDVRESTTLLEAPMKKLSSFRYTLSRSDDVLCTFVIIDE